MGGSQEYMSTKVPVRHTHTHTHTHTQPASVLADTKDPNTDDRKHAPHSRPRSPSRSETPPDLKSSDC